MTKTIDIKSLLIGFLLATSVMLFMGHASSNLLETGRYQVSAAAVGEKIYEVIVFETIIDTKTGSIVGRDMLGYNDFLKK